jgi:hypothetical protein
MEEDDDYDDDDDTILTSFKPACIHHFGIVFKFMFFKKN